MTDLAAWLLAQIAEDERGARACAAVFPSPWGVSDRGHSATVRADGPNFPLVTELDQDQAPGVGWLGDVLGMVASFDPARVLAECEAKRRIVEQASEADRKCPEGDWPEDGDMSWAPLSDLGRWTMKVLALPYADRPEYEKEWAP